MPDLRAQGVERLGDFIAQFHGWRRLTTEELAQFEGRGFTEGWEIPHLCEEDPSARLHILVDPQFPYKPPRIAVFPPPPTLTWPNLEEAGLLCLLPAGAQVSVERVEAVTTKLLTDACDLVNGWHNGVGLERFEDEFESYWNRWADSTKWMVSLCTVGGTSRWVYAYYDKLFTIVADDEQTLKSWAANYFTPDSKVDAHRIPLIRLDRPPRPDQYPASVKKLFSLVEDDVEAATMLRDYIESDQTKLRKVVLSFAGRNGEGFAGLVLPTKDKNIKNGFRQGHMPFHVLLQRYDVHPIIGATVTRCDAQWVHGRDQNPDVTTLGSKTVVLLGVGSLGSGVSELLAKMGIGKQVLVDPDMMAAENACRHSLGVRSMVRYKATQQAEKLANRFPHLQFVPYNEHWEYCCQKRPDIFAAADLIISTIGVWSAESNLNACARTDFPPVLFGWLEAHAAAGHAVAFFRENGCLRCLTDDMGHPRLPVTKWPAGGGTQRTVPMCGGMFQPYGATELSFVQGVVADLAADILLGRVEASTHRVWLGQKKILEPGKGEWHPDWIAKYGDPGDGGRILDIEIARDVDCPVCGGCQ